MQHLRLIREPTNGGATHGSLYLNQVWLCWTLEDAIRELKGIPVGVWKQPGMTAIPAGTYHVALTLSKRFNRVLPLVQEVPGFEGIRMHAGNTIENTEGCILLGMGRKGYKVVDSLMAVSEAMRLFTYEPMTLTIFNPEEWWGFNG